MATRLEALLADGTLEREARTCGSQRELAERCGMTGDAYTHARQRIVKAGRCFPSFEELKTGRLRGSRAETEKRIKPMAVPGVEWLGNKTEPMNRKPLGACDSDRISLAGTENAHDSVDVDVSDLGEMSRGQETSHGHDPPLPAMPAGHRVRGVSTLVDADGETKAQWIKTTANDNRHEMMLEAMKSIAHEWQGKSEPVAPPAHAADDLLACYQLGDPHLGLHAWRLDSQDDWDLSIAERTLFGAADRLVSLSPPAGHALIVNIGDFFHADGNGATTTKGTRVDVDGRWSKVLAVGIRLMRRIIDRCLEKHSEVSVINEIGNHDTHTSVMLATCLAQFYERDPRVIVDTSPAHFHWYRFGKNLIGTHHGHGPKIEKLPGIMAHDRAVDWGECLWRHWITGHVHHKTLHEFPGCTVRTLRTLAPGDAWHTAEGYRSGREMICEIIHREHGILTCNTVGFHQLVEAT